MYLKEQNELKVYSRSPALGTLDAPLNLTLTFDHLTDTDSLWCVFGAVNNTRLTQIDATRATCSVPQNIYAETVRLTVKSSNPDIKILLQNEL